MSTGSPSPVPGFEDQGLTWSDSFEVVTISMPITADNLRSLAVHTDGATLSLQWDRGSVVINLYAAILESQDQEKEADLNMLLRRLTCRKP